MRYYHRYIYFLLFAVLLFYKTSAQDKKLISKNFEGYSFTQLVNEIEANYNYHFYYDSSETDSIIINLKINHATLPELLDAVFQKTNFHYAIDSADRVFITYKKNIQTIIAASFFEPGNKLNTDPVAASMTDIEPEKKAALKVSQDNKLFEVGSKTDKSNQGKATIAGYVRDSKTGEAILGASVFVEKPLISATTDQFGYYAITLPKGSHLIKISSAGMKEAKRQINLYSDGKLDIELQEYIASLKSIVVTAEKASNTLRVQMGVDRLNIKTIKQVPVVFGEADILKVILTLPGVTSVGEASNGFNVRGGSTDQNLILFNDATIYNPSHLFGFFSAFNPDVVKGIELYKSAIPEKYGGRLSSVLDVTMKDGNSKNWSGVAGIGPLTSKITIEGPLDKGKTSIIIGGRTTYSNWLLRALPNNDAYSNSKANFYDANLRISHTINAKNTLYLTGYISNDNFNLNNDTTYKYSNKNINLKWKHIFNNKTYSVITAGIDHYQYSVSSNQNPVNGFNLGFDINQNYFRADFNYSPNNKHIISYGLSSIYYKLNPGTFTPASSQSLVVMDKVPSEQALESALYLGDQYSLSSKLTINAGLRYSIYNYLGPHDVYNYVPGLPKEVSSITDTVSYSKGKFIKTYQAPEVRLSARYSLPGDASLKFSFNTMQQYIHLLSNTVAISPTDIWKLSDPNIKPQQGMQFSLGYYKNLKSNTIETSIEIYYKEMKNYLDYKSGANLVLNSHIETDVLTTKGKAYGIEFLIRKLTGKLNGWLSYTYSRTFLKQDDPLAGELINNGNYYPASFDKPHNANFIGNYRFSHRYSISVNMVYGTGRPITLPIAVFNTGGSPTLYYSARNQYRISDYFRTDISVSLEGNHKVKKASHNSWSFGLYNVTGRQNAYSVYFVQQSGQIKGYQLSIFGTAIPFVTYNIKF